ncbi:hypothetical protein D6851_03290 [Altericroceibacterium spongiae]|uniref:DOMON-like domain-containing protein n=1 Tax=Altericroceibacterium spongiae TaxID=2320269 RepID=A0A420ES44_9SPHN|nr:DOMON-like domain-containing protein [Altericroceibacterium spongiae]RKF23498.1 hypothetical protein D6851_03290 [Altericroceibacterium spongiae]
MKTHHLQLHELHPASGVRDVSVDCGLFPDGRLLLRYRIERANALILPSGKGRGRRDNLWKTTCCELFLWHGDGSYREFNFSPSGQWAAYHFDSYRAGQSDVEPVEWPEIDCMAVDDNAFITVMLAGSELAGAQKIGLSVVLEEEGGHISYWALAHPEKKPDFHDPACFALPLGAAIPA